MEELIKIVAPLIVGGVIGGLATTYYDYRKRLVSDVWSKRFEQYKKLWGISGNLPQWPRDTSLTYNKLYNISVGLKNWYFNDGGILLSTKSRILYGEVQELLTQKANKESADTVSDKDYDTIKKLFSTLRSQMTKDLSSRSRKLID